MSADENDAWGKNEAARQSARGFVGFLAPGASGHPECWAIVGSFAGKPARFYGETLDGAAHDFPLPGDRCDWCDGSAVERRRIGATYCSTCGAPSCVAALTR